MLSSVMPLIISAVAPARIRMALSCEPDATSVARNPLASESIATNTPTVPAIPSTATIADTQRARTLRRLYITGIAISHPPQRVDHAHPHRADTRQNSARRADQQRRCKSQRKNLRRQDELGQQAIQRIAQHRHRQNRESQAEYAAEQRDQQRLRPHQHKNGKIAEADGFQNCKLAYALAHRNGHGISSDQQQRKEHHDADGENQEFDVAKLFYPTCRKGRLSFRFRFVRRVGESDVNGFGYARRIIRVIEPQHVPASVSLKALRHALFEIVPLKPELRFVAA